MTGFFQHVINGLSLGAIYALIALGYTMVYGVLKLINFAHGDVFMVGAMMAFYASSKWSGVSKDPTIAGAIVVSLVAMVIYYVTGDRGTPKTPSGEVASAAGESVTGEAGTLDKNGGSATDAEPGQG